MNSFRLYRDDPQHRPIETLADIGAEVAAEMRRRLTAYPPLVAKGRMTATDAALETRVWGALFDRFCRGRFFDREQYPLTGAMASWQEQTDALRREILRRRNDYPILILEGRVKADLADRKLVIVESLHDLHYNHDWSDEAVAARAADEARQVA